MRRPELKSRADAAQSSVAEGADAAISAWVAVDCARKLGQELSDEGEQSHVDLPRGAKEEEINVRKQLKVPKEPR